MDAKDKFFDGWLITGDVAKSLGVFFWVRWDWLGIGQKMPVSDFFDICIYCFDANFILNSYLRIFENSNSFGRCFLKAFCKGELQIFFVEFDRGLMKKVPSSSVT